MSEIKTITRQQLPDRLKQLNKPPAKLFMKGSLISNLDSPCVAVVGSRKISSYGREVTERLVSELARQGITIISGLAFGVDSVAHEACLEVGGKTIAVLPTAINHIYPASHTNLANKIVENGGALISEYDEQKPVYRTNFIERNRIIAALADVVLITEAALKSGSLHTARFALELGRDVMVVPGNITSESSEGCNNLLKHGAVPITNVEDILFTLGIQPKNQQQKIFTVQDESERIIIDLIQAGIAEGDELLEKSGLDLIKFNQTITMLEINGLLRSVGSNRWQLA